MSKVFNMVGGGGGPAASIFVTGLSETDTVTATNGSKTLTGKWTQKTNPAIVVPDGYTQLEYIESIGTQYIDTGVQNSLELSITGDITFTDVSSGSVFGTLLNVDKRALSLDLRSSGYLVYWTADGKYGTDVGANKDVVFKTTPNSFTFDGREVSKSTDTNGISSNNICLFASYYSGNGKLIARHFEISSGTTKVRNFIPSKRNSDSVIGLYDLVNDIFYTNSGTGEFVSGPEIPQTIDGFMIKPIRDFGTWTVTATDGVQTATQDVLVDVSTDYEIEMSLSTAWLYRNGDECEYVTGGWTNSGYTNNSVTMQGGEKRSNSLYFVNMGTDNYVGFGTVNTVNLNSVNFIKVEVVSGSFGGYDALLLTKSKTNYAVSANEVKELRLTDTGTFALDVSEITTSVYIMLRCGSGTTLEIGKVWLEK